VKVPVLNLKAKKVGDVELDDAVFGATVKEHLFWETVRWQLAKRRAGTHKTKSRSEVSGTGAKPYRQKGTGRARRGTMRGPHHVGGGTAFGPHPRDHGFPLNKKVRKAALRSALSLRAGTEGGLVVLDAFELDGPRTKSVVGALGNLGVSKALIVDGANKNLSLSARNLPGAKYLAPEGLNVYDLLKYETLVITKEAALAVQGRLSR
jgi:large subunit ribosomal protein L4